MKSRRTFSPDRGAQNAFCVHPKAFVFFDKSTRSHRFEVRAHPDGTMPAQEAASLLAMHCIMRGQTPQDFGVVVAVDNDLLLEGLGARVKKLIEAYGMVQPGVEISPRQHEVLRGVLQNLTNKEIAAQLQIGVRTVKFHVSALLVKFGVTNRVSLAQKTGDLMSTVPTSIKLAQFRPPGSSAADAAPATSSPEEAPRLNLVERRSHA